jgi:uncharacterized protein (TIGR00251 family)
MSDGSPLPAYLEEHPEGTVVHVYVQPKAARDDVVGLHGRALKLKVKAPPVDDKANEAVADLLAARLGTSPRAVVLVTGRTSRSKRFLIEAMATEEVASALETVLSSRAP